MKKCLLILLLVLTLTGCKTIAEIKPDTIVDIPLQPTQSRTEEITQPATEVTEPATEPPTETEPVTETAEPTEGTEATEPAARPSKTNTGSKPSGSKKPSQGSANGKPKATEPPTEAPTLPPTEPPTMPPTEPPAYDPSGYVPGSLDRAAADDINARRQDEGLGCLTLDERLCAIASVRAWETAQTWNSIRPDGSSGITVLAEYGYAYCAAAENLYFGPADAAAMVEKWMGSESHRANILLETADTIGVGSFISADGVTFVAVLFVG